MNVHLDDRRHAFFDIFSQVPGQVNAVYLRPGQVCGWHRHHQQTDEYFCVAGSVKVGMVVGGTHVWKILSAQQAETVVIPPGAWHGYMAIDFPAILLQYVDHKYDPSDEERQSVEQMGIPWND